MANSYVKISCERGEIRTFGGNRNKVIAMVHEYRNMSLGEFMFKHPYLNKNDYDTRNYTIHRKR